MMLGSIPQQDVFQRVTSAKDERTAMRGSVLGGTLYFMFAFVPMFLAYAATLVNSEMFGALLERDSQLVLPTLIVQYTPVAAQIIFFGAVLSAIMSCSSATLLAPSVAFSENILKGLFPRLSDRAFLRTMRVVMVCFAGVVLLFALNSHASIFKMVENSYKVTLVAAFIPLFAGLYWKAANTQGALFAITAGLITWISLELFGPWDAIWPPQLVGFLMAGAGMIVGSLLPYWVGRSAVTLTSCPSQTIPPSAAETTRGTAQGVALSPARSHDMIERQRDRL
jgi:SSS family solute:Na+ symporter